MLLAPLAPLVALSAALAVLGPAPQQPGGPAWRPPVEGPVLVLDGFDPPPEPWLSGHRGVDLALEPGDPVLAAGSGTVTWAAPVAGRGVVVVEHEDGRRTTYEPIDPAVVVGDIVAAGDVLGVLAPGVGHCGEVPTCLHWGLRRGEDYVDPMLLLRRGRPVLLP